MPTINPRDSWSARRPRRVHRIPTPTKELWLHHTAGPGYQTLRQIQNYHMDDKGWSDIAYSYLVTVDAQAWEGRGAGVAGGHTAGRNTVSHAICVVGDYQNAQPSDDVLETVAWLTAHGILAGWWNTQITGPHRAAPGAATSCCGNHLIARIPDINRRAAEIVHALATPAPSVAPKYDPPFHTAGIVDDLSAPGGGAWVLAADGGVFTFGGAPFYGSAAGTDYFAGRTAARIDPWGNGYVITATSGETYHYPQA